MNTVMELEGVGKEYLVRHEDRPAYRRLSEDISSFGRSLLSRTGRKSIFGAGSSTESFWALNNVSFDVQQGDRVGIIGKNGAGKSTLLKLLSRITEPTRGRIGIKGRVGSLLEVGTGFHPELTGRENIFLNGSILGMSQRDVTNKFDQIVDFAGVEKFLDTPVKRYSSGMYVRLAFSVAAHLEPDILIIDEVLAVGDVEFQKKCLGRMGEFGCQGRTLLFVSHNMNALEQICNKGVLLSHGEAAYIGPLHQAIGEYLGSTYMQEYDDLDRHRRHQDLSREVEFVSVNFENSRNLFQSSKAIEFVANIRAATDVADFRFSLTVFSITGEAVASGFSSQQLAVNKGQYRSIRISFSELNLVPGRYYIGTSVGQGDHASGHKDFDILFDVLAFEVLQTGEKDGVVQTWSSAWGNIRIDNIRLEEIT